MRALALLPAAIVPLVGQDFLTFEQAMAIAFPSSGAIERFRAEPDAAQRAAVTARAGTPARATLGGIYVGHSNGGIDGIAFIDHVIGRTEHITWLCVLSPTGVVRRAEVMAYREPYGGEVRERAFLAQFDGLDASRLPRVGSEVRNIAGATLSVHALTDRLRFLLAYHDIVLRTAVPTWLAGRASPAAAAGGAGVVERAGALGQVPMTVRIAGARSDFDRARFAAAAAAALAAAAGVDASLNAWDDGSALARFNAAGGGATGELERAIALAADLQRTTGGAIDASVMPILRCWRDAVRAGHRPAPGDLANARAATGWSRTVRSAGRLQLPAGGGLDLSAVRTGLALDAAGAALRLGGGAGAVLHGGGSTWLAVGDDAAPGIDQLLTIDLRLPVAGAGAVRLTPGRALAVSSSDGRVFSVDGWTASHLIDPRTAQPVPLGRAAAVIASDAATADALATAACILAPDEAQAAAKAAGAVLLLVREGRIQPGPGWP